MRTRDRVNQAEADTLRWAGAQNLKQGVVRDEILYAKKLKVRD